MDKIELKELLRKTLLCLCIASSAATLTACNEEGGEKNSSNNPEISPQPIPTPDPDDSSETGDPDDSGETDEPADPSSVHVSVSFQVIDGYLKGAEVFADLNRNFSKDTDEPSGITDVDGKVTLDILDNYINESYPIRIISQSRKNDINTIAGKEKHLTQDVVMMTYLYPENVEGNSDPVLLTPFTTLASLTVTPDMLVNLTSNDYLERIRQVSYSAGIDVDTVSSDYNNIDTSNGIGSISSKVDAITAGELIVRNNLLPQTLEVAKEQTEGKTYQNEEDIYKQDMITSSLSQYEEFYEKVYNSLTDVAANLIPDTIVSGIEDIHKSSFISFRSLGSGPAEDWRCGVTRANNVYCWGKNFWGNLGDPDVYPKDVNGQPVEDGSLADNYSDKPVAVKIKRGEEFVPLTGIKTVALGNRHACAVSYAGDVYCWGSNNHGQLGIVPYDQEISAENGNEKSYYAVKVLKGQQENNPTPYLSNVDYLQLGQDHSCALTFNGEVYCWGDNSTYQLGADYGDIQEGGYEHRKDLVNNSGQLTLENWLKFVYVPVKVPFPDTVAKVKFLSNGNWTHCALVENVDENDHKNMYCWGSDALGFVSHDYKQYRDNFINTFTNVQIKQDSEKVYTYNEYWENDYSYWYLYDLSGVKYPIYSRPVTRIESYYQEYNSAVVYSSPVDFMEECYQRSGCRIDMWQYNHYWVWDKMEGSDLQMTEVSSVSIGRNDTFISFIMGDKSYQAERFSSYRGIEQFFSSDPRSDVAIAVSDVKKVHLNIADDTLCLLTSEEMVWCPNNKLIPDHILSERFGNNYVKGPDYTPLRNVIDLSTNNSSLCLIVKEEDSDKTSLYCGGSSSFGQLGTEACQDEKVACKKESIISELSSLWSLP